MFGTYRLKNIFYDDPEMYSIATNFCFVNNKSTDANRKVLMLCTDDYNIIRRIHRIEMSLHVAQV